MKPFLSIGVTSYKRYDLLKECLSSILQQEFGDFEIIVGNDYPQQKISAEFIGINDPRITYINHPRNLGPIHNANVLLSLAEGRYFTWLADDDLYSSNFLKIVHASLMDYNCPPCIFTSYFQGESYGEVTEELRGNPKIYKGRDFLKQYLLRNLKTIGCYGVFDIKYLRNIGGMEHIGNGNFSPYADNLLVIKASLLDSIVYINNPLVFFRTHAGSNSYSSTNAETYRSAQSDLVSKSAVIFRDLKDNYDQNLSLLLKWCIEDYCVIIIRSRFVAWREGIKHLLSLSKYINSSMVFNLNIPGFIAKMTFRLALNFGKLKARSTVNFIKHFPAIMQKKI
jgi:glycosyltransferase involved in cell wall biosynthesis